MRFSTSMAYLLVNCIISSSMAQDNFPVNARIWPIGDSRVEGSRPEFESYRFYFWKNLVSDNRSFDIIGMNFDDAEYPSFKGMEMDRNHDGYGGIRTDQMLEEIGFLLDELPTADIVLLGLGGNDLLEGFEVSQALSNMNAIIDAIQADNPNVTIFVEQIAPAREDIFQGDLKTTLLQYNVGIVDLAMDQTNGSSNVIAVDMATNWQQSYFADEVHYNEAGAQEVADRYTMAVNQFYANPTLPGDLNGDGFINLLDVQPFVDTLSSGQYVVAADINGDGTVDLLDVQPFISLLAN